LRNLNSPYFLLTTVLSSLSATTEYSYKDDWNDKYSQ
jgi:hypothetical protein